MKPDTLRLVAAALTRATESGYTFTSRNQLSQYVAGVTGLSDRTVRRAFEHVDVDHLLGQKTAPSTRGWTESSDSSDSSDRKFGQFGQRRRETPAQSVVSRAPSRARSHASSGATSAAPAAGPPSPPAADRTSSSSPSPGRGRAGRYVKRVRRIRNELPGWCQMHPALNDCEMWVEACEGFIPVPYSDTEPTPLHCVDCWALFDAIDVALTGGVS